MPDRKNIHELRELVANSRDIIKSTVDYAYRQYNNGYAPPDDIEELTERIIELLLDHDCHNIKMYDSNLANLRTWLSPLVRHKTWDFIKKKRKWDSLDETVAERLLEHPKQELNIISQERQMAFEKEIEKLSEHDRCLINLIREEVPVAEIAECLNIKPLSVNRMKHKIIQKIKAGLNKNGGGANLMPELPTRKMKIIQNNQSTFFSFAPIN